MLRFLGVISTEPLTWRLIKVWLPVNFIFVGMLITSMFRYDIFSALWSFCIAILCIHFNKKNVWTFGFLNGIWTFFCPDDSPAYIYAISILSHLKCVCVCVGGGGDLNIELSDTNWLFCIKLEIIFIFINWPFGLLSYISYTLQCVNWQAILSRSCMLQHSTWLGNLSILSGWM